MSKRRKSKKDSIKITPKTWSQFKKFAGYFKPNLPLFIVGWVFLLFSSITAVIFPTLMGQLVGQKEGQAAVVELPGIDLTDLTALLITLFVVFALQAIFSFFRIFIFNVVTERTLLSVKTSLFGKLIGLPKSYFDKNDSGDLVSRVSNDVQQIQTTLNTTVAEFFRQILTVFIAIIAIFYFSPQLAVWMLSVIPVLAIVALFFGRFVRKLSKSAQEFNAKSNTRMQVALSGIVNVKAFNNEKMERNRFMENMSSVKKLNIKSGLIRGLFVSFIIFCMFGGISFVIWKAKMLEADDIITNAQFVTFIFYTVMLGTSFASLPELYANLQKALGATEEVMNLIDLEEEIGEKEFSRISFREEILFQKLSFAYPTRSESKVLDGLDFKIMKGQHVGLVGGSGGGKSTIAALLMGLYRDYEGSIAIDNVELNTLHIQALRGLIGYVPQDIMLFNGTIAENISYGKIEADTTAVEEAAKLAGVLDFSKSLNEGLATIVGERGVQLSGGQRQRIAIARAILKDPEIIIFDEATSALDNNTEYIVQSSLSSVLADKTVITIAHRLTTVKNADTIFALEKGEIVESGTHDELLANKGHYYDLYNKSLSEIGS